MGFDSANRSSNAVEEFMASAFDSPSFSCSRCFRAAARAANLDIFGAPPSRPPRGRIGSMRISPRRSSGMFSQGQSAKKSLAVEREAQGSMASRSKKGRSCSELNVSMVHRDSSSRERTDGNQVHDAAIESQSHVMQAGQNEVEIMNPP